MQSSSSFNATLLFGATVVMGCIFLNRKMFKKESNNLSIVSTGELTQIGTPKILSVTRIHKGSSSHMASIESVLLFVENANKFASKVLICVSFLLHYVHVERRGTLYILPFIPNSHFDFIRTSTLLLLTYLQNILTFLLRLVMRTIRKEQNMLKN